MEFAQALILEKNRVKALECELNTAKPIGRLRAAAIIGSRTKCLGGLRAAVPSGQGGNALLRES